MTLAIQLLVVLAIAVLVMHLLSIVVRTVLFGMFVFSRPKDRQAQ